MKFLKNKGLKQYLAVIAAFGLLGGGIYVYSSHAQTPLTVVKKYTKNAPQLSTVGTKKTSYHANIDGVGKVVVLDDLKISQTGPPEADFYDKSMAEIPKKYHGYKVRLCVDVRVVKVVKDSFNQLVLDNIEYPGSPSIFNNVSASKNFSNRCTSYSKITNQGNYQSALLASASAVLAYVRNITVEVAK